MPPVAVSHAVVLSGICYCLNSSVLGFITVSRPEAEQRQGESRSQKVGSHRRGRERELGGASVSFVVAEKTPNFAAIY